MQQTTLFNLSWQKYLVLLFALLSAGFFASGAITWIAANWDYFSKFQKLYSIQALFFITVGLGLSFYYREVKKAHNSGLFSLIFSFLSVVFLGGMFALIGQTYQTGADPWELFAVWSLCQIPFLILFPNIASALLLATTSNTALILADHILSDSLEMLLIGLNLILLVLYEYFGEKLKDIHWRILPKLLMLALVGSFFALMFRSNAAIISWLISAGLIYYYKERRFDFLNLIILFIYVIISFHIKLLLELGNDFFSGVFLVTILAFASTIGSVVILTKWFKAHNPMTKKVTWHIYPLFILLILFCTGLFLATAIFTFELLENEDQLVYLSFILLIIASIMHFSKKEENDLFHIAIDMLLAIGLIIYFIFFLFESGSEVYLALMLVISIFFYVLRTTNWLRFLISALAIIAILCYLDFFELGWYINEGDLSSQFVLSSQQWLMILGLGLYYYCAINRETQSGIILLPIAWALLLIGLSLPNLDIFRNWEFFEPVAELPEMKSVFDWFNIITVYFFTHFSQEVWLLKSLTFVLSITPIIFFLLISRRFVLSKKLQAVLFFAILLLCVSFISANETLACIALLFLAYLSVSRILFVVAILGVVTNLAAYYYLLTIPLLYKSFLLMALSVIWLCFMLILIVNIKKQDIVEVKVEGNISHRHPLLIRVMLTAITALFIGLATNYSIYKYEDILNTGEPIILKTAPLDPRSLMQGDYMSLNYEILQDIYNIWYEDPSDGASFVYALLKRDELGITMLCRLQKTVPTSFDGCTPDIYLPINVAHWQPRLPSQDYFFAEGKGEYYAQAEYAEYRFKNGKALLFQLLDKNLNPL
ncbi:GDYXXLXY domain-containing protein [Pasteurella canis]|uniref:GDYXXLXY domain-containing protein n=1 Tax=Pasteurella canis TaxID=753 RepID=UPI000D98FC5D|nr:GDYXXLXY domain-containing protein [Pasteurella canis]SPY33598.1 membrane protein [Pasteurella canis]